MPVIEYIDLVTKSRVVNTVMVECNTAVRGATQKVALIKTRQTELLWSQHHYLFDEAMAVAQQATIDILQVMREDVNDA